MSILRLSIFLFLISLSPFTSLNIVIIVSLKALYNNFNFCVVSGLVSVHYVCPWEWVTFSCIFLCWVIIFLIISWMLLMFCCVDCGFCYMPLKNVDVFHLAGNSPGYTHCKLHLTLYVWKLSSTKSRFSFLSHYCAALSLSYICTVQRSV